MSRFLLVVALLVSLGTSATPLAIAAPPALQETDYVSIETPAGGKPMLVIGYPWKIHKDPSVEVRAYIPGEEDSVQVRPLQFRSVFMKVNVTIKVYDTQAASAATRTTSAFLRHDIPFLAVGERNLLGRPAVCVTCRTGVLKPNQEPFPDMARWAIYPFAEPWAADDQTLFLSLPEETFSEPARIRVFFMRGGDLAWSQTLKWPGLGKSNGATE